MAYQVATLAPQAMQRLERNEVETWILHAMDQYDNQGVVAGISTIQDIDRFVEQQKLRITGLALEDACSVLEKFICGLRGRSLVIKENNEEQYTDTETIFLSAVSIAFDNRQDNFCFFKAMMIHQWAQTWYGTWRVGLGRVFSQYPDSELANRLFHSIETFRLDARIKFELPGLYREIQKLCVALGETLSWISIATQYKFLRILTVLSRTVSGYWVSSTGKQNRTHTFTRAC